MLKLAHQLKLRGNRRLIFVFGDMRELGENAKKEHEEVAKMIVKTVDELYCVGELTKHFVIPLVKDKIKTQWFANSQKLGLFLKNTL